MSERTEQRADSALMAELRPFKYGRHSLAEGMNTHYTLNISDLDKEGMVPIRYPGIYDRPRGRQGGRKSRRGQNSLRSPGFQSLCNRLTPQLLSWWMSFSRDVSG